jgi:hypothetical protein
MKTYRNTKEVYGMGDIPSPVVGDLQKVDL